MLNQQNRRAVERRLHERISDIQWLIGGISSNVYAIQTETNQQYIIRLYDKSERDDVVEEVIQETRSLKELVGLSQMIPEYIISETDCVQFTEPMLMMTKVDGEVIIEPEDVHAWVEGLAKALVAIHSLPIKDFPYTYFPYQDYEKFQSPKWSQYQDEWTYAIHLLKQGFPQVEYQFIHRDYHPNNVLWKDGEVTGVVDWVNACMGPAQIDIGHCRVNLIQLFNEAVADEFLSNYMEYTNQPFDYDPRWDLITLTDILFEPIEVYDGWVDLGVHHLTNEIIKQKLDGYFYSTIHKIMNHQ